MRGATQHSAQGLESVQQSEGTDPREREIKRKNEKKNEWSATTECKVLLKVTGLLTTNLAYI